MRRASTLAGVTCALSICCGLEPRARDPQEQQEVARPSPRARAAATQGSPVSLTATDGTGLELLAYRARAVRQGPLALTELHLTFRNPAPRVIEGRFSITMPAGATISRFAMLLPDGWQEAEVVERQKARVAYESFLHRNQDPALLEKEAGNQFRARIFPIPARGKKEIKISYSQELVSSETPYRLHLRGLPRVGSLDVKVWDKERTIALRRRAHQPTRDLLAHGSAAIAGLRNENLVVARIKPVVAQVRQPIDSLLVLFDTSASRALGFAKQVEKLGALLDELKRTAGPWLPLQLACFDQEVTSIFEGSLADLSGAHLQHIIERGALGASDLQRALRWAGGKPVQRILLVTDAVATAGAEQGTDLRASIAEMSPHVRRLDALLVGGIQDRALARILVQGNGLAADGALLDGDSPADLLVQRLTQATTSGIRVAVPGARWVWPEQLDGVQAGDERLIYAELEPGALPEGQPLPVLFSTTASRTQAVQLTRVTRPLLERAWVKARIARLQHLDRVNADAALRQVYREQIIDLSQRFRVLSDHTALLVLETEADYERFGIDRRALADILIATPRGPALLQRQRAAAGPPLEPVEEQPAWLKKKGPERKEDTAAEGSIYAGEEGRMGRRSSRRTGLYGLRGPRDNPDPHLAKRLAEDGAKNAGVLGLLKQSSGSHLSSIFGRDTALGSDAENALGGLKGNEVGEGFALGGLGLIGSGRGGGGTSAVRQRRGRRARAPRVSAGRAEVRGALDRDVIRRIIRRHINEVRFCYERELQANPSLAGRIDLTFVIASTGQVVVSRIDGSTVGNRSLDECITRAVRRWLFPRPKGGGIVNVRYPFVFRSSGGAHVGATSVGHGATIVSPRNATAAQPPRATKTYSGRMKEIMRQLAARRVDAAFSAASRWREERPGDVLALVALGESLRALGRLATAARAYGSIIDLYPSRADMRRFAGGRLESLGQVGRALATDTYREAVEQRPDHPNSHRLLAWSLLQAKEPAAAFEALERGIVDQRYPADRFEGVGRILEEDLGLIGAAWLASDPSASKEIEARLARLSIPLARGRSLRFVLSWETDANDVDLHIHDRHGDHAFYERQALATGGKLYADVTTGYGPECFTIEGRPRAFPYRLRAHYYSRGPMGYGMGTLQIIQHDGRGRLELRHRPFVVMNDDAFVELGAVERAL